MATMKSLVDQFYDEDLALDDDTLGSWSTREFSEAKVEQLISDSKAAGWALQMPRRLGGDATARDLSLDKKFMRRIIHMSGNLLTRWGRLVHEIPEVDWAAVGPRERSVGARIIQEEWLRDRLYLVGRQQALVATVSRQMSLTAWGERALRVLVYEESELKRIYSIHGEGPATK